MVAQSQAEFRAAVQEIVREEQDLEITALDVRHILEEKWHLKFDALLPRKHLVIAAFQSVDNSGIGEPLTYRERSVKILVTGLAAGLVHSRWWQPQSFLGWLGLSGMSIAAGSIGEMLLGATVIPLCIKYILQLPISPNPTLAADEMHGLVFPGSTEALAVARRRSCGVDHLVYTCSRLEDGMGEVEKLTGVRPAYGGRHPGLGTHNALLSLGGESYLEIISPDPSSPPPTRARPFGLDEGSRVEGLLSAFAVHPRTKMRWRPAEVNLGATIQGLSAALQLGGWPPGPINVQTREAPDGSNVRWTYTSPFHARGPKPFIIDWGANPGNSPHQTAPKGCKLAKFECVCANTQRAEALHTRIGLTHNGQAIAVRGGVPEGTADYLVAWVDTPRKGRVQLGLPKL